ncbi:MAG TPA: nucleoside deaminase [Saprospiraceae bacterium]|nr:nucleoside deaminase [Saprospiraceae bacterium]
MNDLFFMQRCADLAAIAAKRQESPVGSLVVLKGQIIGEGIEAGKAKQDVTCHAEVEAIRDAVKNHGKDLSAATLYTTHEPCILCSYVIRHHRIGRVVIRQAVAHIGGASSAYPILTAKDIPIWGEPPVMVELWG